MSRRASLIYTCQDMSRLLSDAMDRRLPWHAHLRMHLHLRICLLCRQYQHQLTLLRDVLRKSGNQLTDAEHTPAPGLSPEAKARIQRAIESQDR